MSTNTPKAPYGYMPANKGGKDMGALTPNDKYWEPGTGTWRMVYAPGKFFESRSYFSDFYYTRPIDVGPENELVGEDEIITADMEACGDAGTWGPVIPRLSGKSASYWNHTGDYEITGLRRRKVVKDEKGGEVATLPCQHPSAHYSAEFDNFYCDCCHKGMGQEYYATHVNERVSASGSAPEVTKGASLPRMPLIDGMELEEWLFDGDYIRPTISVPYLKRWLREHFLPPQPKTREQEDEEWINSMTGDPQMAKSLRKAIAYARGEKLKE